MAKNHDDSKKLLKHVSARNPEDGSIQAQIGLDAFILEGVDWTPEEKTEFIRRATAACREICDWFTEKLGEWE